MKISKIMFSELVELSTSKIMFSNIPPPPAGLIWTVGLVGVGGALGYELSDWWRQSQHNLNDEEEGARDGRKFQAGRRGSRRVRDSPV